MNAGKRQDAVAKMMGAFGAFHLAPFAPKGEEKLYSNGEYRDLSREDLMNGIKEELGSIGDGLSGVSQIHPAWIARELENESPKMIGIVLRWLPSAHVRYILEHLPKRVKLSLPKLVESFAVPTPILRLIKERFERKFSELPSLDHEKISVFGDLARLSSSDLEALFKDIGLHELAMAFHNVDPSSIRVLLNRMSIATARALQQRMKDVVASDEAVLKDARYTILEVALDQEDIDKLLIEAGLAAFSKSMENGDAYSSIRLKLDPVISYIFKRYVDQYAGVCKLTKQRQAIVMDRYGLLSKAGIIENS